MPATLYADKIKSRHASRITSNY